MNRANLEKLAAYLEALPADYKHFGMRSYFRHKDRGIFHPAQAGPVNECGTVACAVGHAPSAGITTRYFYTSWTSYAYAAFDVTETEFDWCFSGVWASIDDTHYGAAKRIRYMLEHGVPEDALAQACGHAPYLFAQDTTQ